MLKKELKDIWIPTMARLSPLGIFGLYFLLEAFNVLGIRRYLQDGFVYFLFLFVFMVQICWIAANYGLDAFRAERKDKAFEYLLSFPFSKYRLLLNKLMPRLVSLAVIIGLFMIAVLPFFEDFFESKKGFLAVFTYLFIFFFFLFSGFFSSLMVTKQMGIGVNTISIGSVLLLTMAYRTLFYTGMASTDDFGLKALVAGCLTVLIIYGTAFVWVYRKLDARGLNIHGRKFFTRLAIPLMTINMAAALLLGIVGVR